MTRGRRQRGLLKRGRPGQVEVEAREGRVTVASSAQAAASAAAGASRCLPGPRLWLVVVVDVLSDSVRGVVCGVLQQQQLRAEHLHD